MIKHTYLISDEDYSQEFEVSETELRLNDNTPVHGIKIHSNTDKTLTLTRIAAVDLIACIQLLLDNQVANDDKETMDMLSKVPAFTTRD